MAFWPRDQRKDTLPQSKAAKSQSQNHPNLEQGLIGAAVLSEDVNKRLDWVFTSKDSTNICKSFQRRLSFGKQSRICSPAQPSPPHSPRTSIRQRAEQGANFLRTYIPDVEIPEELIRNQLIEDTTRARELRKFDPYLGDLLSVLDTQQEDNSLLATFAAGETNQELRYTKISCLEPSDTSDTLLHTFSTPIQQIVSCRSQDNPFQTVRTYGSTQLLNIDWHGSSIRPTVHNKAILTRNATNNEAVVDMEYMLDGSGLLLVGDAGSVFECNLFSGKQCIPLFRPGKGSDTHSDYFWRLSLATAPSSYFLMSKKKVLYLDKRSESPNELFSLPTGKHVLSSIENCRSNNILSLCSTNQVIWMDVRFPRTPLLTYMHGREYDRYLSCHSIYGSTAMPMTILTSRSNNLVTVYDISRSSHGLISLNTMPYCLNTNQSLYQSHVGQQFIERDNCAVLLRLSEGAGLLYNELNLSNLQAGHESALEQPCGSKMIGKEESHQTDISSLGLQEFSQVDFQAAYEEMFAQHFGMMPEVEEVNAEATDQMVESFSSYLLNKEFPTKYALTSYDIAFRAADDSISDCRTRAIFLTDSIVHSEQCYQALEQGKLSPRLLRAPMHFPLLSVLRKFDSDLSDDLHKMMDYFQKFNLSNEETMSSAARKYEEEARQQLTLDLALSLDVFSELSPSKPKELDQTLEVMTEALSLGNEPPPVEFGFLNPLEKKSPIDDGHRDIPQGLDMPIGVRLLLQGWDTSDPEHYHYDDPYNAGNDMLPIKFKKPPSQNQSQVLVVKSQRPPTVLPSNFIGNSQPDPFRKTMPKVQSQSHLETFLEPPRDSFFAVKSQMNFSQEPMASTQILPGPHGGRSNAKKKAPKKRLGGF